MGVERIVHLVWGGGENLFTCPSPPLHLLDTNLLYGLSVLLGNVLLLGVKRNGGGKGEGADSFMERGAIKVVILL